MMRLITAAIVVASLTACGTSNHAIERDQEIARLRTENAKLRQQTARQRPVATRGPARNAEQLVALGNRIASAPEPPYLAFVDRQPAHCAGALCWKITNTHRNPVLLKVEGKQVVLRDSPMGTLLPPGSTAYLRLTKPGRYTLVYYAYDAIQLDRGVPSTAVPRRLFRCRWRGFIGDAADAHWGGEHTRLTHAACG
jgi:hypothetical protein